ncbi:hypothetical protein [Streptomyces sp. NPDC051561]|uniref:hypothetical protein n=1 Tax=Streptomyces sp. NPDC051561 TaxID=3365658 RepID=UPI003795DA01
MDSSAGERLADVVAAAVETAAEAGEAGRYNADVADAVTAVVRKVAARVAIDAEVRGFSSGWREAMDLASGREPGRPRLLRFPSPGDPEEPGGVAPSRNPESEAPATHERDPDGEWGRGSGPGPAREAGLEHRRPDRPGSVRADAHGPGPRPAAGTGETERPPGSPAEHRR